MEGLNRKKLTSSQKEGILPADSLGTQIASLPWVSCLINDPADFGLANNHKGQFPKFNQLISLPHIYVCVCVYTHTHLVGSVSLQNPD